MIGKIILLYGMAIDSDGGSMGNSRNSSQSIKI